MNDPDRTVVVVGATGTQGGPVTRSLLEAGYGVRAVTRDPASSAAQRLADQGARPVVADLRDADALASATDGARLAFLHLPMSLGGPDGAGAERAAADVLRKAGGSRWQDPRH